MVGTLLLFGFEPFGEEPVNPAGEAARALDGRRVGGTSLRGVVLPVTWAGAFPALRTALEAHAPLAVLGVGQGRGRFAVETCARNRPSERVDNAGGMLAGNCIDPAGPSSLDVRLDALAVRDAVRAGLGDHTCELSSDAGDFLCNHTLYRLLAATRVPAGFLHVPRLGECPQETTTRAVERAAGALAVQLRTLS